jgi:predicted AAA+ superfamily ATPase
MIKRFELANIKRSVARGKSVLLFGPRQVGKTTLIKQLPLDRFINLMDPATRLQYEKVPQSLAEEILQMTGKKKPLIAIDEIQKVPNLMDAIQVLIDDQVAQFVITGSSARQIKNLLPGRVIRHQLWPCTQSEYPSKSLEQLLINGTLPGILGLDTQAIVDEDLISYVSVYLEEEVRKEALVRNLGAFSQFLQLACIESGNLVSFRKLSQEVGISHTTIAEYFNILEDCMIVERFEPITHSQSRKRLSKSPKYCIFDLGVRRLGAVEGPRLSQDQLAHLFEQWVGLELKRLCPPLSRIQFWRDHAGPEVDWVMTSQQGFIPIEVKWTDKPSTGDCRHIHTFLNEYNGTAGYLICRIERPRRLAPNIVALPWHMLDSII